MDHVERPGDVTRLLREAGAGRRSAVEALLPILYGELREMARRQLGSERPNHTLQPTALVHEAYLKLIGPQPIELNDRAHFFAAAAAAMRRILVDHARTKKRLKRGGGAARVPLDDALDVFDDRAVDLVALDEALRALAGADERKARLVELRFFAGLDMQECADALGVSLRSAERDWTFARAWLREALESAQTS